MEQERQTRERERKRERRSDLQYAMTRMPDPGLGVCFDILEYLSHKHERMAP